MNVLRTVVPYSCRRGLWSCSARRGKNRLHTHETKRRGGPSVVPELAERGEPGFSKRLLRFSWRDGWREVRREARRPRNCPGRRDRAFFFVALTSACYSLESSKVKSYLAPGASVWVVMDVVVDGVLEGIRCKGRWRARCRASVTHDWRRPRHSVGGCAAADA